MVAELSAGRIRGLGQTLGGLGTMDIKSAYPMFVLEWTFGGFLEYEPETDELLHRVACPWQCSALQQLLVGW